MNKQQTAIEWLDENLQHKFFVQYGYYNGVRKIVVPLEDYMKLKQEANKMFEQQIIDTWEMGRFNIDDMGNGEEYYQETFK